MYSEHFQQFKRNKLQDKFLVAALTVKYFQIFNHICWGTFVLLILKMKLIKRNKLLDTSVKLEN